MVLDADPEQLRAVLDELLGNAIAWAADASTIGINIHADEHTAVHALSNTGTRIPQEERGRVFDLFYRTDSARRTGVPGRGLGLTFARAIVEQHGGAITVSEPHEAATTFTIRLPTNHPALPERHPGGMAPDVVRECTPGR